MYARNHFPCLFQYLKLNDIFCQSYRWKIVNFITFICIFLIMRLSIFSYIGQNFAFFGFPIIICLIFFSWGFLSLMDCRRFLKGYAQFLLDYCNLIYYHRLVLQNLSGHSQTFYVDFRAMIIFSLLLRK